jgi:hypothetical protein
MKDLLKNFNVAKLVRDHNIKVPALAHKLRGTDARNRKVYFTDTDKEQFAEAIKKIFDKIQKEVN